MIYENPTIEILIGDHPVVSSVDYNVISKFEIDRLRFDGPIDIKFLRYPLILPSLLPSLFLFFSLLPLFFSSYPFVFSPTFTSLLFFDSLSPLFQEFSLTHLMLPIHFFFFFFSLLFSFLLLKTLLHFP